jgi:hypothetical protein
MREVVCWETRNLKKINELKEEQTNKKPKSEKAKTERSRHQVESLRGRQALNPHLCGAQT